MNAKVTVVLPTYNSQIFLDQCLPPLLDMDYPNYDVVVVDDCSSDGTVKHIQQYYPHVRLIELCQRSGHSAACNEGIRATEARYVYIVEHHTIVTKDALSHLMTVMHTENDTAICYSKQVNIYNEQEFAIEGKRYAHYVVNQQCERIFRNNVSIDAFSLSTLDVDTEDTQPVDVTSAGTFSYLIDKEKFQEIGYFDEDYFIHINDYELTLRAKATGLKCYYVPASVNYHKSFIGTVSEYNFRGGQKYPGFRTFVISKNRWLLILSYYALRTLFLLAPALIIYELLLIGFVVRRGVFISYLKALGWLMAHPFLLLKKRKHIQQLKLVKDKELLVAGELNFVPGLAKSALERRVIQYLTQFLTFYWNGVKNFL